MGIISHLAAIVFASAHERTKAVKSNLDFRFENRKPPSLIPKPRNRARAAFRTLQKQLTPGEGQRGEVVLVHRGPRCVVGGDLERVPRLGTEVEDGEPALAGRRVLHVVVDQDPVVGRGPAVSRPRDPVLTAILDDEARDRASPRLPGVEVEVDRGGVDLDEAL